MLWLVFRLGFFGLTSRTKNWVRENIYDWTKEKTIDPVREQNGHIDMEVDGKKIDDNSEVERQEAINGDGDIDINYEDHMPKDMKNFKPADNLSEEERARVIATAQQHGRGVDVDDKTIIANKTKRPSPIIKDQLKGYAIAEQPEEYQSAIFPEEFRADIPALKLWVETVKIANLSDDEAMEEYYQWRENPEFQQFSNVDPKVGGLVKKMKERRRDPQTTRKLLVDSIAYMVARKLWYVGRKPASMSDWDWNEKTKHLRPAEGTFDMKREERWRNFKYTKDYVYESGVH